MRCLIPAMILALTGCNDTATPGPTKSNPSPSTTQSQIPAPPAAITVKEVRGEELASAIAGYKDKVVVCDLWAIWCTSCVKKFPHFVEMHKKYADKGLVCVSVAMDKLTPASYSKDKILSFLKDRGAAFPNFAVLEPELDEVPLTKLLGENYRIIPLMVIFDKAGRKVWGSDAGPAMNDQQLDKFVEDLLAK
jgi:thiol-disulfide isomerase/thioredoxin